MQNAPVIKGSGLVPVEDNKSDAEVHVFGKNLEERVIDNSDEHSPSTSFQTLAKDNSCHEEDIEIFRKRKFDAITGEEDEETVFQGEFKLFAWDLATSNWIEKGRGQLKLNDNIEDGDTKSRLIMRLSGTLRIILNVAIKASYFRVIACTKTNIRFTDSQTVWAASGPNTQQLQNLIEERLKLTMDEQEESRLKKSKSDTKTPIESKENNIDTKKSEESSTKYESGEESEKGNENAVQKESDGKEAKDEKVIEVPTKDNGHESDQDKSDVNSDEGNDTNNENETTSPTGDKTSEDAPEKPTEEESKIAHETNGGIDSDY